MPDDVTVRMIKDRISRSDCEAGAILDGFPRTPAQAEDLEQMLHEFKGKVNVVPYITAAENILVERTSAVSYTHLFAIPKWRASLFTGMTPDIFPLKDRCILEGRWIFMNLLHLTGNHR